jgi:hypothetical protein
MRTIRSLSAITGLFALAAGTASAHAGHLNIVLEAQLDGREQVTTGATNAAMIGDPKGRAQAYVFGVDNNPATLCYLIVDVKKMDELTLAPGNGRAAHIHEGARGSNGPVVANLAWPQDGQASDCLFEGQAGKFPTNEAGLVQRILKNPSSFYINVHNSVYPAGAIRGQLSENEHQH